MDNEEQQYRQNVQPSIPEARSPDKYIFSQEEMVVLNECHRESFFKRSLPIGTFLGFGTFAAVKQGYLKPNAYVPKLTLSVIIGYFIGKFSYQEQCAEKLMALPGSHIGQLLRERRDGKMTAYTPTQQPNMPTSGDIYSDAGPGSSLNLDMDRPLFDNNDPGSQPVPSPPSDSTFTYEDLLEDNRNSYLEGRKDPYRVRPPIASRTNKYGDAME